MDADVYGAYFGRAAQAGLSFVSQIDAARIQSRKSTPIRACRFRRERKNGPNCHPHKGRLRAVLATNRIGTHKPVARFTSRRRLYVVSEGCWGFHGAKPTTQISLPHGD